MANLYQKVLLDHFHNPRNKGFLVEMDTVKRANNPRCGDDIAVGVCVDPCGLIEVRFKGRGCSICLASASMMSEAITGLSQQPARQLVAQMLSWLTHANEHMPVDTTLIALDVVRQYSARQKCVVLPWEALDEILTSPDRANIFL